MLSVGGFHQLSPGYVVDSLFSFSLANEAGEPLGFIAEEPRGFFAQFSRQIFRTHRPFRAIIMDKDGTPVLWVCCSGSTLSGLICPDPQRDLDQAAL